MKFIGYVVSFAAVFTAGVLYSQEVKSYFSEEYAAQVKLTEELKAEADSRAKHMSKAAQGKKTAP